MQTDAPTRKTSGRLSREDQRRLGDILQRVYDDVVRQGVPDRFRHLLDELEHPGDSEQARPKGSALHRQGGPEQIEAKGGASPSNKGSH
jgi:Anti-sigma factor NepR